MRLLPKDKELGWTPYAWLIYLSSVPLFGYMSRQTTVRFWAPTIAGMVVLLGLYFWGYWIKGKKLLWIIAAITLLGMVSAPSNPGASVYFIYAAAFVASTGDTGFAVRILPLVLVAIGVRDADLPFAAVLLDSG